MDTHKWELGRVRVPGSSDAEGCGPYEMRVYDGVWNCVVSRLNPGPDGFVFSMARGDRFWLVEARADSHVSVRPFELETADETVAGSSPDHRLSITFPEQLVPSEITLVPLERDEAAIGFAQSRLVVDGQTAVPGRRERRRGIALALTSTGPRTFDVDLSGVEELRVFAGPAGGDIEWEGGLTLDSIAEGYSLSLTPVPRPCSLEVRTTGGLDPARALTVCVLPLGSGPPRRIESKVSQQVSVEPLCVGAHLVWLEVSSDPRMGLGQVGVTPRPTAFGMTRLLLRGAGPQSVVIDLDRYGKLLGTEK